MRLLEELNAMELEKLHGVWSGRGIPFKVTAEYVNGGAMKDTDRKPIGLARIRHGRENGRPEFRSRSGRLSTPSSRLS